MPLLFGAAMAPNRLFADRVALKSGMIFHDVKAEPVGKAHRIRFADGRVRLIPNSQIKSVRPVRTTWEDQPKPLPQQEDSPPLQNDLPKSDPRQTESKQTTQIEKPEQTKRNEIVEPKPIERPDAKRTEEATSPTIKKPDLPPKPPTTNQDWGPVIKSAILPGWGQYSLGEKTRGSLFAVSSLFVFSRYLDLRQQHTLAEAEYNDPLPVGLVASQSMTGSLSVLDVTAINLVYLSQKEQQVYRLQNEGNSMLGLFALLWSWNMLDIGCRGPLMERCKGRFYGREQSGDLPSVLPAITWRAKSVSASLTFSF